MNDNILNQWQYLNAKAEELKTLTRACAPSERVIIRAKEIALEIREVADDLTTINSMNTENLFSELVLKYGEQYGGKEAFVLQGQDWITCVYSDCGIRLKEDGWHYGSNAKGYATPTMAYKNRSNTND